MRKAVVLAGAEGLSSIIEQLVTEWVTQNEAALQNNNPIGLKYSSGTTTATKHWIDAIVEPQIEKLKQDISRIEDLELLKKISTRAWKINETTNFRSEVLADKERESNSRSSRRGITQMKQNQHVGKVSKKAHPLSPAAANANGDIFSFKKHSMDYFTISGVKLRTGLNDPKDLYIMAIEELLDNAVDFLQKYYKGYSGTRITVYITKKNSVLHIKIRNTNQGQDVKVFENIDKIFNPEMTYGSKQNLKIIIRGLLGDVMKQILALAYILIHYNDDRTAFTNAQWNQPLIIRHNGLETHIRVIVDPTAGGSLDIKDIGLWKAATKTQK